MAKKKTAPRKQIDLTAKVYEYKELQRVVEASKKQLEALKEEITAEMSVQQKDEMLVDVFKVTWKEVLSQRFDSASFKRTHEKLYKQYCVPSVSRPFKVS